MAEVFVPPIQPTAPAYAAIGFTKTVTTATAVITGSNTYDCFGVLVQSSAKDDSNAAMSGVMYVQVDNGQGTFVNAFELVQGESVFVACSNTSQVKVKTQSGSAWVRGFVYRAQKL